MTHDTPPKRIWKCAGCGLQMPGTCDCVTNVATSWEPDHMQVWKDQLRLETTSENIARDMSEGRFPERSEPQVIVIPEAERKTILTSEADAMVAAALTSEALRADDYGEWCRNWGEDRNYRVATEAAKEIAADIRSRIPQPASAALDKLIAEAVAAATPTMQRAARVLHDEAMAAAYLGENVTEDEAAMLQFIDALGGKTKVINALHALATATKGAAS